MQIRLTLKPEIPLSIPFNYNYQLQSSIYALLNVVGGSQFRHDSGFKLNNMSYKDFCFGRLEGRYHTDIPSKKLCFEDTVSLEIRSPFFSFTDALQRALESRPWIKLYDTRLNVIGASLTNRHLESGNVSLMAVTPVVVHHTFPDGHTYYYSTDDPDFSCRLILNTAKKYEALTGTCPDEIRLHTYGAFKKTVTLYKNIYLTGYTGCFKLDTTLKMAEFIYNTGLGERNAAGFGFVVSGT